MSDPDHDNRKRNQQIAENEAARGVRSGVRLSAWAIGTVIVVGLIVLAIFL